MLRNYLFLFAIITFFTLFGGGLALAQVQNSDVTISITPSSPSANQAVKATVKSYITDLDKAYISWSLNDEIKARGVGKTEFSFTLGNLDTTTLISAEIGLTNGKTLNKSLTIAGTSVDLLWEAVDSYSPPFYKGKTLVGREGEINL
jgi:hypothetical protein